MVLVEIVTVFGRRRVEGCEKLVRIEFGLFAGCGQQRLGCLMQRLRAASRQVFDLELETAGGANARDRGRVEAQADRLGDRQQLRAHGGDDVRGAQPGAALLPRLQNGKCRRRVGLIGASQKIQAGDRDDALHSVLGRKYLSHRLGHLLGSLQRCAVRELHYGEEVALVLDWQEPGGNARIEAVGHGHRRRKEGQRRPSHGDHVPDRARIRLPHAIEAGIEDAEEDKARRRPMPQQNGAERRA